MELGECTGSGIRKLALGLGGHGQVCRCNSMVVAQPPPPFLPGKRPLPPHQVLPVGLRGRCSLHVARATRALPSDFLLCTKRRRLSALSAGSGSRRGLFPPRRSSSSVAGNGRLMQQEPQRQDSHIRQPSGSSAIVLTPDAVSPFPSWTP